MLETISAIICVLFIIIGLVEVFRSIVLFVLRPKGEDTAMTIVPICGHNEEAEYLLRSAAARVKWADNGRERRVICLDCGMDLETRMICEKLVHSYGFMELCTMEELQGMLRDQCFEPARSFGRGPALCSNFCRAAGSSFSLFKW